LTETTNPLPSDAADPYRDSVEVAAVSDIGMRRRNNQDSLAYHLADGRHAWGRAGHLFVVADGMGAHAAGELASRLAVDLVQHHYEKNLQPYPVDNLHRALIEANNEIHRRGQANIEFRNMGTTCSALVFVPEGAICAHVGDSRIYRLRDSNLEQLTFDHSLVWEMQAAGGLNDQATDQLAIPKNVITRSLGPNLSVVVDLEGPFDIRFGDKFILCSDGLSGQLTDTEIGVLLQELPPERACRAMVDLANLRGGPDNISVIAVQVKSRLIEKTSDGSESIPDRTSGFESKMSLGFSVGAAVGVLASLIFLLVGLWPIAVAALVLGLSSLIVGLAAKPTPQGIPVNDQLAYGRAPYRRYRCQADAAMADRMAGTAEALEVASHENGWGQAGEILRERIPLAKAAHEKRDFSAAIRDYAELIIDAMSQIRIARNP
jgi:protein phosphatase